jgi:hypothetical protein
MVVAPYGPELAGTDRFFAVDERGTGLRVTWRPALRSVNLSLWLGDRCVEAFHLSPAEAARLAAFLVTAVATAIPTAGATQLRLVRDDRSGGPDSRSAATTVAGWPVRVRDRVVAVARKTDIRRFRDPHRDRHQR